MEAACNEAFLALNAALNRDNPADAKAPPFSLMVMAYPTDGEPGTAMSVCFRTRCDPASMAKVLSGVARQIQNPALRAEAHRDDEHDGIGKAAGSA